MARPHGFSFFLSKAYHTETGNSRSACAFGTARAGLRLIRHHHSTAETRTSNSSSSSAVHQQQPGGQPRLLGLVAWHWKGHGRRRPQRPTSRRALRFFSGRLVVVVDGSLTPSPLAQPGAYCPRRPCARRATSTGSSSAPAFRLAEFPRVSPQRSYRPLVPSPGGGSAPRRRASSAACAEHIWNPFRRDGRPRGATFSPGPLSAVLAAVGLVGVERDDAAAAAAGRAADVAAEPRVLRVAAVAAQGAKSSNRDHE